MQKVMLSKLMKLLPFASKKYLFKLKLYFKAPILFLLKNKSFNSSSTPLLILSLPRSGSSWIGSILGKNEYVRYLREPATTSYTINKPNRVSVFDQTSCDNWPEYQKYINDSLDSKPNFTNSVIAFPKQWSSPKADKKVVIKEVNPLVIDFYQEKTLKLIYLVRHPFSVARSYQALNWKPKEVFTKKFNSCTLKQILCYNPNLLEQSFYYQMGYLQGWIEALMKYKLSTPSETSQSRLVRYEDVCAEPENKFQELFSFADIPFLNSDKTVINSSLAGKQSISSGDFSLTRKASDVIKIKVNKIEYDNYTELMNSYIKGFNEYYINKKMQHSLINPSYKMKSSMIQFLG